MVKGLAVQTRARGVASSALSQPLERRSPTKSERTRLRILESAARIFRRQGYTATTLQDIAGAARMKAGSLYYHFTDKQELVAEMLDIGVHGAHRAAQRAVRDLPNGAPPLEKLRAALRSHLRFILTESDFASANLRILSEVPRQVRERHLVQQRAYGRFLAGLFESAAQADGVRPGIDLSVMRMLCLGALNWSIEWYEQNRLSPDEIVDQLITVIERGMIASRRSRRSTKTAPPAARRSRLGLRRRDAHPATA